jgi:hypothetical protein
VNRDRASNTDSAGAKRATTAFRPLTFTVGRPRRNTTSTRPRGPIYGEVRTDASGQVIRDRRGRALRQLVGWKDPGRTRACWDLTITADGQRFYDRHYSAGAAQAAREALEAGFRSGWLFDPKAKMFRAPSVPGPVAPPSPSAAAALRRIVAQTGINGLVDALGGLAPADLVTVMLEVYRRQAARIEPAQLLTNYQTGRFAQPAGLDPAERAGLEVVAFSLLPEGYEALDLSPLCPLGTSSVVATVDQNKVVSTVRNTEVVSDSTNVLALEAALRRRRLLQFPGQRLSPVRLAACQRQVRAQGVAGRRGFAHFGLLSVVCAGRDQGRFAFEAAALVEQIGYFVSLVAHRHPRPRIKVALTDLGAGDEVLESEVLQPLRQEFPDAGFGMDPDRTSGRGYYIGACYKITLDETIDGTEVADGGCVGWTRTLLTDNKERLVIGGLGIERVL